MLDASLRYEKEESQKKDYHMLSLPGDGVQTRSEPPPNNNNANNEDTSRRAQRRNAVLSAARALEASEATGTFRNSAASRGTERRVPERRESTLEASRTRPAAVPSRDVSGGSISRSRSPFMAHEMEEIIARLRKDMVALQESNRKDMESLQESKRKDLESLQESSRKDLEWLQESNILLVKERDEQERRAKREVREAARVHKEHQALLKRVEAGEHETEKERYLAAELLETKEALLLSRAEAAQNAGMDLALIEEQEVNCALNSCTLTRTLTLTLTLMGGESSSQRAISRRKKSLCRGSK